MKIKKIKWLLGTLFLAAILHFTACQDPNETGFEILPQDDLITAGYVDTFTVFAKSMLVDSVLTQQAQQQLFGTYLDPEFGTIQAGMYSQFTISNNLTFGDTLTLDSIFLYLDVFDAYGKWEDEQLLEVYELTEDMPDDSLFSNDTLAQDRVNELSKGFSLNFGDLGGVGEVKIPLDTTFGKRLLFADPTVDLVDNAAFRDFFKGLFITSTPTSTFSRESGAIFYTDLASSASRITMHYHAGTEAKTFDFQISSTTNRYHSIQRTDSDNLLLGTTLASTSMAPQYHFVQAGGLIQMFLKIPYLDSLELSGINKAELVIPVDPNFFGSNDRFEPPGVLFAYLSEEDSVTLDGSEAFSSAEFDATNNVYSIRLTNYTMQVVTGLIDNTGLILIPSSRWYTMNRAVIGGTGNPLSSPVLKVTYTTLPGN